MKKLLCGLLAVASVSAFAAKPVDVIVTAYTNPRTGASFASGYEYNGSKANCSKPVSAGPYGQADYLIEDCNSDSGYVCIAKVQLKRNVGRDGEITKIISTKKVKAKEPCL